MNSRPRPGPPDPTASSRTSPTGRGRKPPPPGPGRGGGRAMGISGRDSTTARVAVGRAPAGSDTCTDCVPPGPRMMGPLGCAPGARAATRGGGGGAGVGGWRHLVGSGGGGGGGAGAHLEEGGGGGRRRLGMLSDRLPVGTERVGLLAAKHDTAGRQLGCRGLGRVLAPELLRHRLGLIVLQRRGVALDVVFVRLEPIDHLLVGEAEVLRELVHALLRHRSLYLPCRRPPLAS